MIKVRLLGRQTTLGLGQRLGNLYISQLGFMPKTLPVLNTFYLRSTHSVIALPVRYSCSSSIFLEEVRHFQHHLPNYPHSQYWRPAGNAKRAQTKTPTILRRMSSMPTTTGTTTAIHIHTIITTFQTAIDITNLVCASSALW